MIRVTTTKEIAIYKDELDKILKSAFDIDGEIDYSLIYNDDDSLRALVATIEKIEEDEGGESAGRANSGS